MSSYYTNRSSFRSRTPAEDVDPMTSMSGIGDVMLVFACGLMTALVVAWSVDLGAFSQVDIGEEVPELEESVQSDQPSEGNYVEMGRVYMDAETGQYYLVEE